MTNWIYRALAGLCVLTTAAGPRQPSSTAVFAFRLDDTSLQGEMQGPRSDEQTRLLMLDTQLRAMLKQSGCCTVLDLGDVAKQAQETDLQACGGCDVDLARKAGAIIAVTGWVQKVSNLILNINIVARDVGSGRVIGAGSVDIRGNTDESWTRGLSYLIRNRLHPSDW